MTEAQEHEIEACYSGGYGEPYYQPHFSCSCGFRVREETWEEAGAALDAHLAEVSHD